MIVVELANFTCNEPSAEPHSGGGHLAVTTIGAYSAYWDRVVYLPQLAIVVAVHRSGFRAIVPVEDVIYMHAANLYLDPLADLEAAIS